MKLSARNVLPATVINIQTGAVNSEVTVRLEGGQEMVSIITNTSARHLDLRPGAEVRVIVKASNVMLGVE
ncbi:MAG: TOBE domain-containing protein [Acidobacteriota bacterium]|jgi:molybdate transport system regulatory protein|nr:TOBE domain-containing protein [Acidobacteriota bacterium]